MSICGSVYCLRRCQSGPSPSPLLSIAISCACVCVCGFIPVLPNISLHMHKCTCIHAHTPAPSLRQVIMVGGKILPRERPLPQAQLYNRLRCVYVRACVCVCVCGSLQAHGCFCCLIFLYLLLNYLLLRVTAL